MLEALHGPPVFVPVGGIEIGVSGAGHGDLGIRRKYLVKDVSCTPRVVVRRHDNDAFPALLSDQAFERLGFFPGVVGVLGKGNDAFFWHTALDQIVGHELGNSRIGTQANSAGNDRGREILAVKFRGPRGTVGVEIVVAQNDDGVGVFKSVFNN